MPLERDDLEYFANDIKTTIRETEHRLSLRIGKIEDATVDNTVDIAILKSAQSTDKSSSRNNAMGWGGAAGSAVGTALMVLWHYFIGSK